jgi:preprotein translocase subunit SecG
MFVTIFFLMTSLAMATSHHHKKKHPKPKATPTKTVQLEAVSRKA